MVAQAILGTVTRNFYGHCTRKSFTDSPLLWRGKTGCSTVASYVLPRNFLKKLHQTHRLIAFNDIVLNQFAAWYGVFFDRLLSRRTSCKLQQRQQRQHKSNHGGIAQVAVVYTVVSCPTLHSSYLPLPQRQFKLNKHFKLIPYIMSPCATNYIFG